jgi:hypothetical protein
MVLEYCENGPLKEYLRSKRQKVNEEMHEKLYRFACGICKGMNFLASHGVLSLSLTLDLRFLTYPISIILTLQSIMWLSIITLLKLKFAHARGQLQIFCKNQIIS